VPLRAPEPLHGAARVWLSEPSAERRSYAEASQADRAFDPTIEAADIERLKADVVLECSGSEPGIRSSLAAARPEGTVIVVGGGRSGLDPIAILLKELRVLGSFTYADEFAEVIALLADGALQVADLTSEIASIDGAPGPHREGRQAVDQPVEGRPERLRHHL
jgi:L-idonate 5-dehydrogenase